MENETKLQQLQYHYHEILKLLGEDAEREGLLKTPLRVAKAMQTLTRGYEMDAKAVLNSSSTLSANTTCFHSMVKCT